VNKRNEIEEAPAKVDRSKANQIYSEMRASHEETFAANGQILREIYFDHGRRRQSEGRGRRQDQGRLRTFAIREEDFKASAMCARGWVVLATIRPTATSTTSSRLQPGRRLGHLPVLNCDTYDTYFIDYGSDRKAYVEAFMRNINWDEVNCRLTAALQMQMPEADNGSPELAGARRTHGARFV
jgi:Fe-Mn family superoxide dismutase